MSILYLGGTVFLLEKFNEEKFLKIVEQEQITYTILVPALCQRLLRHPALKLVNKSSLTCVGITGGHLTPDIAAGVMENLCQQVYEAYASTDCGQITMITPEDRVRHGDSAGQPIWAVLLRIMDDSGREVPTGEQGEICCAAPWRFKDITATRVPRKNFSPEAGVIRGISAFSTAKDTFMYPDAKKI